MPPFQNHPDEWVRTDWTLLQSGPVHLFWRQTVLEETIQSLSDEGYRILSVDASTWRSSEDSLRQIGEALDFPDYYGANWNALEDCLRDVATFEYGSDEATAGTVLVLTQFDAYAARDLRTRTLSLAHSRGRRGTRCSSATGCSSLSSRTIRSSPSRPSARSR